MIPSSGLPAMGCWAFPIPIGGTATNAVAYLALRIEFATGFDVFDMRLEHRKNG